MGKMAIVCPPRGHFSPARAGAIEIDIYDAVIHSKYRERLVVIGRETDAPYADVDFVPVEADDSTRSYRDAVIAKLQEIDLDYIEARQHMATCHAVAKAFPTVPKMLFRHSHTKTPKGPIQGWWRARQYRPFDSIAFVSEFARGRFAADFPDLAERTYVAYNGIDTDDHKASDQQKEKLILFAARLIPNKGAMEFVEGISDVLQRQPDWRAEVIGKTNADFEEFNRDLMERMDAAGERLVFRGYQPFEETMKAFARAEIVVVPSIWQETFGRTAMEANAYGAALVSSGRGGLREVSGDAAIYIDEVSAKSIAGAVLTLIQDEEKRRALKEQGRRRSVEKLDIRRTVAVIDEARGRILA